MAMPIAKLMFHKWEEEPISGIARGFKGTFAIFFYGCNMRCVYCQNSKISRYNALSKIKNSVRTDIAHSTLRTYTCEELCEEMINAEKQNAASISFITGVLYVDQIVETIELAKSKGLKIPIVYNSSGYETVSQIKKLDGLIDIYLPDFKYFDNELGEKYSRVPNYVDVAKNCIAEMHRQVVINKFTSYKNDFISPLIIRHLVLPNNTRNSKKVIEYLYDTYGDSVTLSIMSQYTPMNNPELKGFPELSRKLTKNEYDKVVKFAIELGIKNAFIQDGEVANDSFIPDFS